MSSTYRDNIRRLAELDSDEIISNSMADHAADLYECFFENAKRSVKIFCRNLQEEVFGRVGLIRQLESAARRGVAIDVITQERPFSENPFFKKLMQFVDDEKFSTVTFRTAKDLNERVEVLPYNFCTVDGKSYRYERKSSKIEAIASMNQPEAAGLLEDNFRVICNSLNLVAQPTLA